MTPEQPAEDGLAEWIGGVCIVAFLVFVCLAVP